MRHRVFIAINLPEDIKRKLVSEQEEIDALFDISPIRWTKRDNLHITLAFLGYIKDKKLVEVCQLTKSAVQKIEPFFLNLTKICYGPFGKMPPRMIWVQVEKSKELGLLHCELEAMGWASANFSPHITLGRIRTWQWRQINPEERPEIEKEISLSFKVDSIEVMESKLKRQGPNYSMLQSVKL